MDKLKLFWEFVERVNWNQYIGSSHRTNLDKIVLDVSPYFTWEDYCDFAKIYKELYNKAYYKFERTWLDEENDMPSDDGYTDLISSIIGKGLQFYSNIDDNGFTKMANERDYRENFGYLFHTANDPEFEKIYKMTRRDSSISKVLD